MLIDTLNTIAYDAAEGFVSMVLILIYRLYYNDVKRGAHTIFENTPRLLHPYFDTHA